MFRALALALALATSALLLAGPAAAQALVIGGGIARECYQTIQSGTNRLNEADRLCTKALQTETMTRENRAATYVNRGIARMRDGRHDQAIADYDRALELVPDLGAAFLNKGAAHIYLREFAVALPLLDRAIETDTKDVFAAHYNRAIARERTGDVEGAYFDFQKSLALNPGFTLAERQLTRFTVLN